MTHVQDEKDFVNFPVKLPRGLHEAIRLAAFTNRKSIHKQILETLKEVYTPDD